MAGLEKATRNALRGATAAMRRALEADFARQLEGRFAIDPDGTIRREANLDHLTLAQRLQRERIVESLEHRIAGGLDPKQAVVRFVREAAFSNLNRLAALKLMESRQRSLIPVSVGEGDASPGFRQFRQLSPSALGAEADGGYRFYLERVFDDLAREIGVLFDRDQPHTALFPDPPALAEVLDQLNREHLAEVWGEDETIGWIYQYFTPKEQRDEARKASAAPRDSYELAFRNQFFTPRYVVEFLADNTLGRTWYEMRRGETAVAEHPYFVRRKRPIFLARGVDPQEPFSDMAGFEYDSDDEVHRDRERRMWLRPPAEVGPDLLSMYAHTIAGYRYAEEILGREARDLTEEATRQYEAGGGWEGWSFEELRVILFGCHRAARFGSDFIQEPVAASLLEALQARWDLEVEEIPARNKKDPRSLRILDPACGSGHFLLYAFDLLLVIYQEAWDDPDIGPDLRAIWPDEREFLLAVPELILRHNLHGVDIDLRCVQIAQLALWLRAHRTWQAMGVRPADRPAVRTVHVVGAEPLPGDPRRLAEFLQTIENPAISRMVGEVWEAMKDVGEIGSLFKADDLIRGLVQESRRLYRSGQAWEPVRMFGQDQPRQRAMDLAFIDDEAFWDEAEREVRDALRRYSAESRSVGERYRRGLFADDAERGFAFLDTLSQRFDVVLMNPPFGASSEGSKWYVDAHYGHSRNELYAAFVDQGLEILWDRGWLGAITSRTGFFLTRFEAWRMDTILGRARIHALADLGQGVLDAMVEVAAYSLERRS